MRLSHADRSRFWHGGERPVVTAPAVHGRVLCDGTVCATRRRAGDVLAVDVLRALSRRDADAVQAEGARLAAFVGAAGTRRAVNPSRRERAKARR